MTSRKLLVFVTATTLLQISTATYADEDTNSNAGARAKPYHIYKDMIIKSSPSELSKYEFLHPKKPCRYIGDGQTEICDQSSEP